MIGPGYQAEPPRLGPVVEKQVMKTALELAWPGKLTPKPTRFVAGPWGPEGISKVEYSLDEGKTWKPAADSPGPEREEGLGAVFFNWEPTPGEYKIMARATDLKGGVQPDKIPWNKHGMNYGAVVAHPVTVA